MMAYRKCLAVAMCGAMLTAGTWVWIAGCTVNIGDDGVSGSFTIGNKTVTIGLGPAGIFIVASNVPITNIVDATGFLGGTPTDNPTTGTVQLRESSVTLRSSTTGKGAVTAQGVSGLATLRWAIDAPGAVDPCTTGIDLGTFEINVAENGVINIVDEELSLSLAAVSLFLENNVSMCLRMQADFDATIEISGFDVIFGPSDTANDGLIGTFQLNNLGLTNMHILGPGEQAGDTNLLTPGIVRDSRFENLSINDLLTFTAVRDGQVLDTATCPRVNQGDFFAIVQWDGFTLTCFQPVTPPVLGPDQGCCLPDGTCEDIPPEACDLRLGEPAGEGLFCADIECLGACCIQGSCEVRTLEFCDAINAEYLGFAVDCVPNPCPQPPIDIGPYYACCFPPNYRFGHTCNLTSFDFCVAAGGDPQSLGTTCTPDPCPQACCFDDGTCADPTAQDACALSGGTPAGPTSICRTSCQGACCKPDGSCEELTLAECDADNGTYQGLGVVCDPDTCPGGCCFDDTLTCFTQTETECLNSGGDPLPNCEGSGFDLCRIACCLPDGTCKDGLTVDECTAQSGVDDARGTTCANITCAPFQPTKWVLSETLVSPDNFSNDVNVADGRFAGTVVTYTETANSITFVNRDVDNGFENYNITIVSSFPTPPSELIPGETVVLDVTFTHSGTWQAFNPGVQFQYRRNGIDLEPQFAYQYYPWNPNSPDFGKDASTSYSFVVPSVGIGGTIDLVAFLWNCSECNVHWIYRPG